MRKSIGSFKEKYVSVCEDLFGGCSQVAAARDKGIRGRTSVQRFWDELLLLKVNQEFLAQCISTKNEEELKQDAKPVLNELFTACVAYLSDGNFIRVAHSLETLIIVLREIFKKRFSQQGLTITSLVAGSVENADQFFKRLISSTGALLAREDVPILIKSLGLRLYLTILTSTDNVNSNPIASYFFVNDVLDSLTLVLSIKVTADRKRLEVDVVIILLLLLLWRESENVYIRQLSSPSAPLSCLLNTVTSLFSNPKQSSIPEEQSPGWEDVVGYITSFFGMANMDQGITRSTTTEECNQTWCGRSCGLALLYFLVYLNPAFSSNQIWPAMEEDASDHALTNIWTNTLKDFMGMCQELLSNVTVTQTGGVPQAKLALTILRCMLENPAALNYLSYSDTNLSTLTKASPGNRLSSPAYVVGFKSVSCIIVDMAANILAAPLVDADLFYRAAVLIPLVLRHVKAQAWQLSSSSLNTNRLWIALINCCIECVKGNNFHKPGVSEVAELVSGILEWCLATSQDIFVSGEDTEALHAEVMCNLRSLEHLQEELLVSSTGGSLSNKSLVNVVAVKHHYEVQIAALGVRERPTYEQALAGVRKKGSANLKLKLKYPGPGRLYTEGTSDMRMLSSLVKLVINVQKKVRSTVPKLENEGL